MENLTATEKLLALLLGSDEHRLHVTNDVLKFLGIKRDSLSSCVSRLRKAGFNIQYQGAGIYQIKGHFPKDCPIMLKVAYGETDKRKLAQDVGGSILTDDDMPELITEENAPELYKFLKNAAGKNESTRIVPPAEKVAQMYREGQYLRNQKTFQTRSNCPLPKSEQQDNVLTMKNILLFAVVFTVSLLVTVAFIIF